MSNFIVEDIPYLDCPQKPVDSCGQGQNYVQNVKKVSSTSADTTLDVRKLNVDCPQTSTKQIESIMDQVKEWVDGSRGWFDINHIYKDLTITDRRQKKTISECLRRLVNEKILDRKPNVNGIFRKLEKDIEEMDLINADPGSILPLKWVFGLESLVNIYSKNIIVIAGESNKGKSAFLLNFVKDNQDLFPVSYFNSEMGCNEFRLRLDKFNMPIENWHFRAYERSNNFADVIIPDAINIIDYLEILDNFYLVVKEIKDIFDVLDKGIAIIALQKSVKSDYGRGGEFSLEKPRLYLSISNGKAKIMKAKNWADPTTNPNGMYFNFKLVDGTRFITMSVGRDN